MIMILGYFVGKQANSHPGLKLNQRTNFSCINYFKKFFTIHVLCCLSLVLSSKWKVKHYKQKTSLKGFKTVIKILANLVLDF